MRRSIYDTEGEIPVAVAIFIAVLVAIAGCWADAGMNPDGSPAPVIDPHGRELVPIAASLITTPDGRVLSGDETVWVIRGGDWDR